MSKPSPEVQDPSARRLRREVLLKLDSLATKINREVSKRMSERNYELASDFSQIVEDIRDIQLDLIDENVDVNPAKFCRKLRQQVSK